MEWSLQCWSFSRNDGYVKIRGRYKYSCHGRKKSIIVNVALPLKLCPNLRTSRLHRSEFTRQTGNVSLLRSYISMWTHQDSIFQPLFKSCFDTTSLSQWRHLRQRPSRREMLFLLQASQDSRPDKTHQHRYQVSQLNYQVMVRGSTPFLLETEPQLTVPYSYDTTPEVSDIRHTSKSNHKSLTLLSGRPCCQDYSLLPRAHISWHSLLHACCFGINLLTFLFSRPLSQLRKMPCPQWTPRTVSQEDVSFITFFHT